jgi:hypothetical protein
MAVFCTVAQSSLLEVYQCFTGPHCLHHQVLSVITQLWSQQAHFKRW